MIIRQLELTDKSVFMAFNALLLTEKESNPFIETKVITDFVAYQTKLRQQETEVADPNLSRVTTYFAFIGDQVAGKISCRWELEKGDLATVGGHIGYVVSPNHRRQGVATALLRYAFEAYRQRGIERLFITALSDNLPSRRTIEAIGGQWQDDIDLPTGQSLSRYWINLN